MESMGSRHSGKGFPGLRRFPAFRHIHGIHGFLASRQGLPVPGRLRVFLFEAHATGQAIFIRDAYV